MKVALIGATGNVGLRLLAEARRRGHTVTAIARRRPEVPPTGAGVAFRQVDVYDEAGATAAIRGHDAVINSTRFVESDARRLLRVVKAAAVPRLLVVGGAGSLEIAPGVALVDTPQFPAEYKPEGLAAKAFLETLRGERDVDWTFLSPSRDLSPGERTGRFRLGGDQLLVDANGESRISMEDFAIAMLDELEQHQHSRQRFTVGY